MGAPNRLAAPAARTTAATISRLDEISIDSTTTVNGRHAVGVAEAADARDGVEPGGDLADHGVVGRKRDLVAGDDEELAARGAARLGRRLGHRDGPERVLRVRRRRVDGGVAGAAGAARRRVAALDHELRNDPVEHRVVEVAVLGQSDERGCGVRRSLGYERDRELAAVRLHDRRVRDVWIELGRRRLAFFRAARLGRLHRRAARRGALARRLLVVAATAPGGDERGREQCCESQMQPASERQIDVTSAT